MLPDLLLLLLSFLAGDKVRGSAPCTQITAPGEGLVRTLHCLLKKEKVGGGRQLQPRTLPLTCHTLAAAGREVGAELGLGRERQ